MPAWRSSQSIKSCSSWRGSSNSSVWARPGYSITCRSADGKDSTKRRVPRIVDDTVLPGQEKKCGHSNATCGTAHLAIEMHTGYQKSGGRLAERQFIFPQILEPLRIRREQLGIVERNRKELARFRQPGPDDLQFFSKTGGDSRKEAGCDKHQAVDQVRMTLSQRNGQFTAPGYGHQKQRLTGSNLRASQLDELRQIVDEPPIAWRIAALIRVGSRSPAVQKLYRTSRVGQGTAGAFVPAGMALNAVYGNDLRLVEAHGRDSRDTRDHSRRWL